jgi:hypothetical protein
MTGRGALDGQGGVDGPADQLLGRPVFRLEHRRRQRRLVDRRRRRNSDLRTRFDLIQAI